MINCGEKKSNNTHNAAVMLVRVEVGLSSRKILRRCFCPRIVHIFFFCVQKRINKNERNSCTARHLRIETDNPNGRYSLRKHWRNPRCVQQCRCWYRYAVSSRRDVITKDIDVPSEGRWECFRQFTRKTPRGSPSRVRISPQRGKKNVKNGDANDFWRYMCRLRRLNW